MAHLRPIEHDYPPPDLTAPKVKPPITIWASFGVFILAVEVYVLIKWVTGPYFEHVPSGPTEVPAAMKIGYWAQIAALWVIAPIVVWVWVIRPRIRTGRFTSEGLMIIWFAAFGWFYDPIANFFSPMFTYTSYGPNWGSWVAEIPGWRSISAGSPGATQSYPMLFTIPSYVVVAAAFPLLTIAVMKWTQRRFPSLGGFGLYVVAFVFAGAFECSFEILWLRCGMYTYASSIPWLTLWHGHYYQLPIYEFFIAGGMVSTWASLMFFKNDQGQTFVERGLEHLSLGRRSETGLRFLALTPALATVFVVFFAIPFSVAGMYSAEWPRDVQERSYFTNHICGPGTDQTCGSSTLPLPHRGPTVHFDPHGDVVVPPGVPQPGSESATEFRP